MHQLVLILDFGSQVTQLIARRLRENNVYCEIKPWNKVTSIPENCVGVILSGSPYSVHQEGAPLPAVFDINPNLPMLGICYGAQLMAQLNGGKVERSTHREYGRANLISHQANHILFQRGQRMISGLILTLHPTNIKVDEL